MEEEEEEEAIYLGSRASDVVSISQQSFTKESETEEAHRLALLYGSSGQMKRGNGQGQ